MENENKETGFKKWWRLLKDTVVGFIDDKGLKLSASLSYYTIFSLAPLLIMIISLVGFFLGKEAIQGQLFSELRGLLGNKAALQVQEMIKNIELSGQTKTAAVIGGITLLIGATSVFAEIQDSINSIWRVKAKPKRGWLKFLKDRLLSGSLIVGLGFLFLVSFLINGLLNALNDFLRGYFPDVTVILFNVLNLILSFTVISFLFGIIFKLLPDVKMTWKDVRIGAFSTAVLFMVGQYFIGMYIKNVGTASAYGAAGSIIVILLWVYYSAAIVYFGAEFTRVYAEFHGKKIQPAEYAVYVEQTEKEMEKDKIPLERKEPVTID